MIKLFDNCKQLLLAKTGKNIVGMESDESESYSLLEV